MNSVLERQEHQNFLFFILWDQIQHWIFLDLLSSLVWNSVREFYFNCLKSLNTLWVIETENDKKDTENHDMEMFYFSLLSD